MPVQEIERLSKSSSSGQTRAAISACIATEIRNGRKPDQAKAMCYSMAREKGAQVPQQGGG